MCYLLGSAVIYRAMSAIITFVGDDLNSTFALVQALNRILLTQPGLHEFRNHLRTINAEVRLQLDSLDVASFPTRIALRITESRSGPKALSGIRYLMYYGKSP
ncbi:unnamed protein product [Echinostoma caproni]|uniref:Vacuolar protein 14 C-terminal Fig4-binding domain-containing protein n=1 Tax=Echinostoma caproni TaxID=27848 RepID=A0A3P8L537_9TREM|nr:unnamed protein product [Echinostoma caproni]